MHWRDTGKLEEETEKQAAQENEKPWKDQEDKKLKNSENEL